jgi:D-alanyl-D-alanine carboxypeptidase/D-alanyl-D-alanine-endopeptidase (penicillin-binding protein 4)
VRRGQTRGALGPSAATATHSSTQATAPQIHAASSLGPLAPRTPGLARLQASLNGALHAGGPSGGALVYDLDTHQALFVQRASTRRPPASVEKLYTTVALMRRLGPDERLHTAVLGTGHLRNGTWHGSLYLRGGGDPTFGDSGFNRVWNQGHGPTPNQLVAQLQRRGIRRVTGSVFADESLFDRRRGGLMTAFNADLPDFGGQLSALTYDHGTVTKRLSPALFAVHELALTMRGGGISVRAAPDGRSTPAHAQLLALVDSPPMAAMTRLMDVPSDDLFAELFTKQLGVLFGHAGSIPAGAAVIRQTIGDSYGLHPTILDGSGLSRNDRSSPAQIVDLLRDVWHTPAGGQLAASLPTVGVEGTVQFIGVKTPARDRCIAKTGTLNYVTNLAGYCRGLDNHMLAFALMLDGPPNWSATVLESRMIGAIARY